MDRREQLVKMLDAFDEGLVGEGDLWTWKEEIAAELRALWAAERDREIDPMERIANALETLIGTRVSRQLLLAAGLAAHARTIDQAVSPDGLAQVFADHGLIASKEPAR